MGRKKKTNEEKAKIVSTMLYDEDIKKLNNMADNLGISRQELIRNLIRNAAGSEIVKANIAYMAYQDYMNKKEEKYLTSHNGQNVKDDFKAKFLYAKYKLIAKNVDKNQPNNNQLSKWNLNIEETLQIAKAMWKDD